MAVKIREECGLFGIYDNDGLSVAHETYTALFALQHRGQQSAGITVNDDGVFTTYKDTGLVSDVFDETKLQNLGKGQIAMGHVRYSPSSQMDRANSQPLSMRYVKGTLAIAHNGSLVNIVQLKKELEYGGAIFQTSCDAEIIAYVIARARLKVGSIEDAVVAAMHKIRGSYSLVLMSPQKLIAVRDPQGIRPLCIGKIGNSYCVASETCALNSLGAEYVRDVEPGEVVIIGKDGIQSMREHCGQKSALCIFEFVYFARPDSVIDGQSVHLARQNAGALLAQQHPVEADLVVGVPDSGLDAALGYANESGIPFGFGFHKNRYVGRTFIQKKQLQRERSVSMKLNTMSSAIAGKRVVLVDDSIVRGTTSAKIVNELREAGAKEVHMRISSPPFLHPCYFGTDISSREYLIAHRMSTEEICKKIGADSLGYLTLDGVIDIAKDATCTFCDACFTGNYPMDIPQERPVDKYTKKIKQG